MMRFLLLTIIASTIGGLTGAVSAGVDGNWVALLQGALVLAAAGVGRMGDQ